MLNNKFWDGEMDYGWEDLSAFLVNTCSKFTRTLLIAVEDSQNPEIPKLISTNCLDRFEDITDVLSDIIKDANYYTSEDLDDTRDGAQKLNSWILLGSLTEATLQIYIALNIEYYKTIKWQQWEEFKIEAVQTPIKECIQRLVEENAISPRQAKSLNTAIKDKIKEHTKEHDIQKITLDELIRLYEHLQLFNEEEISYLKLIQSSRNGVHSFQRRRIGTWFDLQYSIRFFCYLLDWVILHLPDSPEE